MRHAKNMASEMIKNPNPVRLNKCITCIKRDIYTLEKPINNTFLVKQKNGRVTVYDERTSWDVHICHLPPSEDAKSKAVLKKKKTKRKGGGDFSAFLSLLPPASY